MAVSHTDNFIEQMGMLTQADGGPRIAGRIFGLLLVEGHPFTLDEMAARLTISKASASTNARLLLASGMIRLVAVAGDRRDFYELGEHPYSRMIDTISGQLRRSGAAVRAAEKQFPDSDAAAKKRVGELADFYIGSADFFSNWASHLDDAPTTTAESDSK